MARGSLWLLKWSAIVALGLAALALATVLLLISGDWAAEHENAIRWVFMIGGGAYALWLLAQIRDLLVKVAASLEALSRRP